MPFPPHEDDSANSETLSADTWCPPGEDVSCSPPISLSHLLAAMVEKNATDLFLCAGSPAQMSVRGRMECPCPSPLSPGDTSAYAHEILTPEQRTQFEEDLEYNLSYSFYELGRFRVNVYTQRGSVALVIRRIKTEVPTLMELGLPLRLGELAMEERGAVFITGPTGSGKSSTLAAMIGYRNQHAPGHIVTIEDPVEFLHSHGTCIISQREVGSDTKSYHAALKNSLRQAPNVVCIGEIRDSETMEFTLNAGETGVLVLGTLHSNNAAQTIERIMSFFPVESHERIRLQLSSILRGIVSQRLIPSAAGTLIPCLEILINTPLISEYILRGSLEEIKQALARANQEGTLSFDQHLYQLWSELKISEETALKYADSANNLRLRIRGIQ